MFLPFKSFENTVGKGEIAHNFSFAYSVFYLFGELSTISSNLKLSSANSFNLEENGINPFPNNTFWTLPYSKTLQTTISNLMKMAESSPKREKTLWEN